MIEQNKNPALLPPGFADLLPPQAQQEAAAVQQLMHEFTSFGYERVKPPLVEFEDTLLAPGPGASLADQTFRLMDPLSHRMMGIRPDITVQIARIASSRMAGDPRPLRLTYAHDVLRMKGSQQRTERQFCQVGCEIVGPEDDEADIEICVVALIGLAALGIHAVTLDLTLPRLLARIFDERKIDASRREAIKDALAQRDIKRVQEVSGDLSVLLAGLLKESGSAEKALAALEAMELSEEGQKDLKKLQAVYAGVMRAIGELGLKDMKVIIDLAETRGFEYHDGMAFSLFADGIRGELGRGGRYNIIVFGGKGGSESATGFTLYMDTVRKAMTKPIPGDIVFVSAGQSWKDVRALQEEGWTVLRGTEDRKMPGRCTHEFKGGKVQKLKDKEKNNG